MNKSQYENYWKSRKPEQGYYHVHGQNGWYEKPSSRNSFPINWGQLFLAGVFFAIFVILIVVGGMGIDNAIYAIKFFLG